MAVLLISRGTMSGGVIIAQCLSEMARFRCVTREDLIASVNTHGELTSKLTAAIADAAHDYSRFSALRRPFKILMRLSLLEYVRQGNVAYFGYSPHLLRYFGPSAWSVFDGALVLFSVILIVYGGRGYRHTHALERRFAQLLAADPGLKDLI